MNTVSRIACRNCLSLRFHSTPRRCAALALLALVGLASTGLAKAVVPASERQVLIDLYNSAGGAGWVHNFGWLGAVGSECTWTKVSCNSEQTHIIKLFLSSNDLVGSLPPSLSGLTNLEHFDVYSNVLSGSIPSLTGMTNLVYFLADSNDLTGPIPSLAGLTNLTYFDVHSNELVGPIPSLAGLTNLRWFLVANNKLTGTIPPLAGLTSLQRFSVANNQLNGDPPRRAKPQCLGSRSLKPLPERPRPHTQRGVGCCYRPHAVVRTLQSGFHRWI